MLTATKIVGVIGKKWYRLGMMLTPEQSRAARGWLDMTQEDLAKAARVSLSTVRDFEKGRRAPIANNLEAMRRVIEERGIRLLFDGNRAAGIAAARATDSVTSEEGSGTIPGSAGHA